MTRIFLVIILLFLSGLNRTIVNVNPKDSAADRCVCGPQLTYVILVEFADNPRTSSLDSLQAKFRDINASFFRQSYGKMWLTGAVKGWFHSDKRLSSFGRYVTKWEVTTDSALNLLGAAESASGLEQDSPGKKIFVVTGEAWGFAFENRGEAVVNEKHSIGVWIHEFGHLLGLPDLYLYAGEHGDPTGWSDVMGDTNAVTFSGFSRIKLGWIAQESIITVDAKSLPTQVLSIASLDEEQPKSRPSKIVTGPQYFLVERRSYFLSGLRTFVFYVNEMKGSGGGILTLTGTLDWDNYEVFGSNYMSLNYVFLEQIYKFSVILLGQEELMVGTVVSGETAKLAVESLQRAAISIISASFSNRVQDLDKANASLWWAWQAYEGLNFEDANNLANEAYALAGKAVVPDSYQTSKDLIVSVGKQLWNNSFTTPEAQKLQQQVLAALQNATLAFSAKRFDEAKIHAQRASELLEVARRTEASVIGEGLESKPSG